jgi:acyl-CoA thioester hydrolase
LRNASTLRHRVAFHETDAMGIVHHANYLRYFEQARVLWLEDYDQPYSRYIDQNLHFAVTRVEVDYKRSARFDDRIEVETWLEKIRGASLRMAYQITCNAEVLVTGATEHACVDHEGRLRRIPKDRRASMKTKASAAEPR